MPMSQTGLILYLMLTLTIWVLGPIFLVASLFVILKQPTSRRMWTWWTVLAVLNLPGITIGGGWLLMMAFPFFEGKSMFLIAPIVYVSIAIPFVVLYKLMRRNAADSKAIQAIAAGRGKT